MNVCAAEILGELAVLGVSVTAIPPNNLRLQPASKVTPELLFRIVESKPEILAALARPAVALPPVEPGECRHCDGAGECSCPACNLRRVSGPVPCSMCRWADRQVWLAASRPAECWWCQERRLHGESGLCPNCAAGQGASCIQ